MTLDSYTEFVVKHLLKMARESGKDAHRITLFEFVIKNPITTPSLKTELIHYAYSVINEDKNEINEKNKKAKQLFIETAKRLDVICVIEYPDETYADFLLSGADVEKMEAYFRGEIRGSLEDRAQLMKKILKKSDTPFKYSLMSQYFKWDGPNLKMK